MAKRKKGAQSLEGRDISCPHEPKKARGACARCYHKALYTFSEKRGRPITVMLDDSPACKHEPKFCRGACSRCYYRWYRRTTKGRVDAAPSA
jgi:hypothetical protein